MFVLTTTAYKVSNECYISVLSVRHKPGIGTRALPVNVTCTELWQGIQVLKEVIRYTVERVVPNVYVTEFGVVPEYVARNCGNTSALLEEHKTCMMKTLNLSPTFVKICKFQIIE